MSVKKKIVICSAILFATLFLLNIVWFATQWKRYHNYLENMKQIGEIHIEQGKIKKYCVNDDDYQIVVKFPAYLQFKNTGFIRVGDAEAYWFRQHKDGTIETNREVDLQVYIWTEISGKYQIGVHIQNEIDTKQCYIDKNLNYLPENEIDIEYNKEIQAQLDEYHDEIQSLLDFAINTLDLELN